MAITNFTPGPWTVRETPESSFEDFRIESQGNVSIAALYPRRGAEVADARLMAAAPALLEALKELLEEAEAFEEHGDRWDKERNDRARAALKQAGAL